MNDRIRKMQRIQGVQEKLRRRAEAELSAIESARSDNANEQIAVITALNDAPQLQGLFMDVTARRLKRLAGEAVDLSAKSEAQRASVIELGLEMKRTEKIVDRLIVHERQVVEKRSLAEISELSLARRYSNSDI